MLFKHMRLETFS